MMDKIVIIDGNSLINRAYYAIQRPMMTKDGTYTQGVYGFLSMLQKIMTDYNPSHMIVAFDRKAPTFRHIEYTDYKAGRKKMPDELAMQLPILKDVLHAMGIFTYEIDGFEADDIMGTSVEMSENAGISAYVITGDKDALQLASDKTSVIITKKGISDFKLYDDAAMMEEYGFDHNAFIDFKALRGDASDNIPGIPGIGEKTALKLIGEYGSVENVIEHAAELKGSLKDKVENGKTSALLSKRLATIIRNVPVEFSIDDLKIKPENTDELINIYTKLEFRNHLSQLLKRAPKAVNKTEVKTDFVFPKAQIIDSEQLSDILEGKIFIEMDTDNSHIALPHVSSVTVYKNGNAYVCEDPDLSVFNGKKIGLAGFNLGKIYYALFSYGVDISNVETAFDCGIARYVIAPSVKAQSPDALLFETFHINLTDEPVQLDLFSTQSGSYENTVKKLVLYEELAQMQAKQIEDEGLSKVYYEIELPLCKVLASMEKEGFRVDSEELTTFGKKLKNMLASIEDEIYDIAGERFNINSPQQLGVVLFEKMGLPAGKKTSKGYSTGAEILEKLAPDYPIVEKVLEYRTYAKLNSTYVEGLLPLIDANGKIHAHFQQTVTATGRISCTEPNLQNIPVRQELGRQLRKVFTAESDDYVLVGADYSQIELRVMASMSGDESLIEAFNGGHDIHAETASKVFGVRLDKVTPQMRSNAKAVNFGVIYGMSSFGLAGELTISRKEAEKYIQDYFNRLYGVKSFLDECVAKAKAEGYIRTLYGRKRALPEINAGQYMVRQLGERLAMNTPIQGTAADIIKIAMNKVYETLEKECRDSKLILQIHDELIIQANRNELEKVQKILIECMESAADLKVKLVAEENTADNWYDLK